MPTFLIHYGEIALKGKNRGLMEHRLKQNILKRIPDGQITSLNGRLLLTSHISEEFIITELKTVFGVVKFAKAKTVPTNREAIKKEALHFIQSQPGDTFAIRSNRLDKKLPFSSQELNIQVGQHIVDHTMLTVNLDHPDITCHIFANTHETYLTSHFHSGLGGMPMGTAGKAICLISGGIDSPVAAYQMMRRGVEVIFLHTHAYPQTNRLSIEKVKQEIKELTRYQREATLLLTPIFPIQQELYKEVDHDYLVILYRRAMIRLANSFAKKLNAKGIITGDNLAQVASQTLENIAVQDAVSDIPIYRPLISLDKQDIIDRAKAINTFEISIKPHEDCCSLFVPKHPKTKSKEKNVEQEEGKLLHYDSLIEEAIENTKHLVISHPESNIRND